MDLLLAGRVVAARFYAPFGAVSPSTAPRGLGIASSIGMLRHLARGSLCALVSPPSLTAPGPPPMGRAPLKTSPAGW